MQNSRDNDNIEKKHTTTKLIICIIIIIIIILLLITSCTSSFWGKIGNVFGHTVITIGDDTDDSREKTNKNLYFTERENTITLDDSSFKLIYEFSDILPGEVVCTTSDADIATCVAYDGYVVVNPKKSGKVTIYATSTVDDIVYKATSELNIVNGKNGIRLNSTSGSIVLANTNKKNVAYNLIGIKGTVNVKVDDESIATATAKNGVLSIKGLKPGSTKITLSIEYGGKTYTAEYNITVSQDKETTTKKQNTTKDTSNSPLKLNISYKQLYVKDTYQIKVTSGKATKWESTNKKVVTVNSKGKITAKGVGTAEINAYDKNGNKQTVRVTVVEKPKESKLEISTSYKVLRVGETFTPVITKGKASRWKITSGDKNAVTVDKKTGKIVAKKTGTVVITATDFWYFGHSVKITIEVVDKNTPINPIDPSNPSNPTDPNKPSGSTGTTNSTGSSSSNKPSGSSSSSSGGSSSSNTSGSGTKPTEPQRPDIEVAEKELNLTSGDKRKLTITKGTVVGYVSSDPSIASVDKNGQIIAKNPGHAVITVTGSNGEKVDVDVYVTIQVNADDLVISESKVNMNVGDKHTITITKGKATDYKSSDESIATVDKNGQITAKKPGTTIITVTGQNGETREVTVEVKDETIIPPVPTDPDDPDSYNVKFSESSKNLIVGDVYTPTVTGKPNNFKSSDSSVASIDPNTGKITAKAPGTATITVTDENGTTDSMTITVSNPHVDTTIYLELGSTSVDMIVGDTEKIQIVQGTPIRYQSSDDAIVEVDEWGRIKAKKAGNAVITVTGVYGEIRKINVTVKDDVIPPNPDKELILKESEKTITIGDILSINSLIKQGSYTSATSDNPDVVEIVDGKIVARKVGEATVTITGDLNSETIKIKVVTEKVILSRPSIDMIIGEKQSVAIVSGLKPITWESSDPSIATVDPITGEITAIAEGQVIIYAVNESGEKTPLIVNVSKSNNTKLAKLQVYINSDEKLLEIGEDQKTFRVEVDSDIELDKYSVVATPADAAAKVEYIYPDGRREGSLENLELEPGDNKVQVVVTAQDGVTEDIYEVNVYKKKSTDTAVSLYAKKDDGEELIKSTSESTDAYSLPYSTTSLDLVAKLNDSRSTISEVKIGDTIVTVDENGNFSVPLATGDNIISLTVTPQDETAKPQTYEYKIHRAVRTVEFEELTDNVFYIESSPITLNYKVYDDDVETDDYSLDDIKVISSGFNGTVDVKIDANDPKKGVISIKPAKDDISNDERKFTISYKNGESTDDINIKIIKDDYKITGDTSRNVIYNSPDNVTFDLKFDTNILKYESVTEEGDKKLFDEVHENGVLKLVSTNGDGGVVTINYPTDSISKVELEPNKGNTGKPSATTSYVLKFTMKKPDVPNTDPKTIRITVNGEIYGSNVTPLNVDVTIRQKYILTLKVLDSDVGAYINSKDKTVLEELIDPGLDGSGAEFDLSTVKAQKIADEENCLVFEFLKWIEVDSDDKEVKDITDTKIKVNRNITLVAKFSDTSKKGQITDTVHLNLEANKGDGLDLFDKNTLYFKGQKEYENLIYPGLEGGHVFTIENDTTDTVFTIKKIIMEEDTICAKDACLNMGYKVRRTLPDSSTDKYYYGSSASSTNTADADKSYIILNKDIGTDEYKEVNVDDEFVIEPGKSAEITVLWKWVDDDANDYKIGEEAVNNNKYKFYIGLDIEKTKDTCEITSETTTTKAE